MMYLEKMMKNLFSISLIKKGIAFTLFASLNQGINFILILLLSFYLSKEDFGILNLFNILTTVLSIILSLGTQSYFGIAYFKNTRDYFIKILNSIFLIAIVITIVVVIIIFTCSNFLTDFLGFTSIYQLYALIFCLLQIFYTTNLEIYRFEEKIIEYGAISLFWAISNFLLTLLFCISYKKGWTGRADAQMISAVIMFIINIILLRKKGYFQFVMPQRNHFKDSLRFGLPLIPHNSTIWIRQGMDRYFLNFFHGAASVGSFSFAYNFAGIIMMVGTAFNATNSIYIFKNLTEGNNEHIKKKLLFQIKIMSILFFAVTTLCILFSFLIIRFAIPKYNDAIPFLFPLCFMGFFQCVYYLFVNFLFFFNETKTLMYITFSVSIIHLLLSYILTRYSSLYTAYLGLLSGIIICALVIWQSNKIYPLLKLKMKHP